MAERRSSGTAYLIWIAVLVTVLIILLSCVSDNGDVANFKGNIKEPISKPLAVEKAINGPKNRLQNNILRTVAQDAKDLRENFDGSMTPRFEKALEIRDYDDLVFFTIVPDLANATDMQNLRSLIGVQRSCLIL